MSEVGDIGRKAGRGLRWSLLGNLVMRAGSFTMSLVLARLLVPEDFGVFAIALAATQFVIYINDAGVIAATVQWRGRLEEVAPTATVVAIASSLTLYALFWVIAPFYARLAGSEDATWVIRVLMATNVVYGLTAVRSATLMRRFEQDKLAWANLAGFVVTAAVSITLAANGAGAYSFAWGQLSGGVLTGLLVLVLARVKIELGFDRVLAARLLRFGLPLCVSLGLEGLLLNMDAVIVGDVLGPVLLGYYLLAYNISSWVPGLIGTAIRYVALPSFARLAEEGEESTREGVRQAVPLLAGLVLPIAALLPALLIGAGLDGIRGAAMAHAVIAVLVALPLLAVALRRSGVPVRLVGAGLARPLLGAALAGGVMTALATVIDGAFFELCVAGGAGLLLFVLVVVPRAVLKRLVRQGRVHARL